LVEMSEVGRAFLCFNISNGFPPGTIQGETVGNPIVKPNSKAGGHFIADLLRGGDDCRIPAILRSKACCWVEQPFKKSIGVPFARPGIPPGPREKQGRVCPPVIPAAIDSCRHDRRNEKQRCGLCRFHPGIPSLILNGGIAAFHYFT